MVLRKAHCSAINTHEAQRLTRAKAHAIQLHVYWSVCVCCCSPLVSCPLTTRPGGLSKKVIARQVHETHSRELALENSSAGVYSSRVSSRFSQIAHPHTQPLTCGPPVSGMQTHICDLRALSWVRAYNIQ